MPVQTGDTYVEKTLSSRERVEPEAVLRLKSEAALLRLLSPCGVTPALLDHGEDERGPWHRIERVMVPTLAHHFASAPLDAAWIERAAEARPLAEAAIAAHAKGELPARTDGGPIVLASGDVKLLAPIPRPPPPPVPT